MNVLSHDNAAQRLHLLDLLVENAHDYALFTLDREGRISSWNPGAQRLCGYGEAEALGLDAALLFTPEDREQGVPQQEQQTALEQGRAEDERWHLRKDGSRFFASGIMTSLTNDAGEVEGFAKIMRDRTAWKLAQVALEASQERLAEALRIVRMAIWEWDPQTDRITASQSLAEIFGLLPGETLDWNSYGFQLVHPEDRQRHRVLQQAGERGESWHSEFRILRRCDGQIAWLEERAWAMQDPLTGRVCLTGLVWDITERKRNDEERATLAQEVAILAERTRMAQELHDTLAQAFTAIKLQLDNAEEGLDVSPLEARAGLERAREIAISSLQEARRAILSLRSSALEVGGLVAACAHMVAQVTSGTGIRVQWIIEGTAYPLPDVVESELFRIAQEALTNALRHAQAGQIVIELTYTAEEVQLRIEDNGRGFAPTTAKEGFGLLGMRERAQRIGGALSVTSQPGQGTRVLVCLSTTAFRKTGEKRNDRAIEKSS